MIGKIFAGFIVVTGLIFGAVMYYMQVYYYYDPVQATGTDDVQLTLLASQKPEAILYENFEGTDGSSSPIRYRACFTTSMSQPMLSETYVAYDHPEPLNGPKWFDCYNAQDVGAALENGEALAFMGTENIEYGVDRVVAILPDGRGFVWHQINKCGKVVFDGKPVPATCPPKPESY